jgi:hypothetical protein
MRPYALSSLVFLLFTTFSLTTNAAELIKLPVSAAQSAQAGLYDPTVMDDSADGVRLHVAPADGAASAASSTFAAAEFSATSATIGDLVRWPSGGRPVEVMANNTAYFRDAFVGMRYVAAGSGDSTQWILKATHPTSDGASTTNTFEWFPLNYYRDLGGTPHCFYSAGWLYYICGSPSISITASHKSKCDPAGQWRMQLFENGVQVGADKLFTMLPEIPPQDLDVPISQYSGSPQNGEPLYIGGPGTYDDLCSVDGLDNLWKDLCSNASAYPDHTYKPFTIGEKGCAMTSVAMVNDYHGTGIGAYLGLRDMNTWLNNNGGFAHNHDKFDYGNVVWAKLAQYASQWGVDVKFLGARGNSDTELRHNICYYGPQVISVKRGGHYVMAVGREGVDPNTPWKIHDPAGGVETNLRDAAGGAYRNTYSSARYYSGEPGSYPFPIYGIEWRIYSPAELVITDPQGRRTGYDPVSGKTYNEIPESAYYEEGIDNMVTDVPDEKVKVLTVAAGPEAGEYKMTVTGTGSGTYSMSITNTSLQGPLAVNDTDIKDIPVQPGEVHNYAVSYGGPSATPTEPSGGYDGGGQRPSDVNKFLRFSNPSQARTKLPAGTSSFRLGLSYGDTTYAHTFSAILNGQPIEASFVPTAGGREVVNLPLQSGSNVLKLSIQGLTTSGRVATDTDRLVFLVP